MAKQFQWRAYAIYQQLNSLSIGAIAPYNNWQTVDIGTPQTVAVQYYYRDANLAPGGVFSDANSSRVLTQFTIDINSSVDNNNRLSASAHFVGNWQRRDDLRGQNSNTPCRALDVLSVILGGGPPWGHIEDCQLATAHTIASGDKDFGTLNVTLGPGEETSPPQPPDYIPDQLIVYNQSMYVEPPSYDIIFFGIQFRNILSADYRPGATLDTNTGIWKSHNRTNGACHILTDTTSGALKQCRTTGGSSNLMGNPPSILKSNDKWYNQKLLGKV